MTRRAVPLLAVLLAAAPAACGGGDQPAGMLTRTQFVQANVAMRSVPDTAANAPKLRLDSLAKHGASPGKLRMYLRAHRRDLKHLGDVYQEISTLVDQRVTRRGETSPGERFDPGMQTDDERRFRDSISRMIANRARLRDEARGEAADARAAQPGPPPGRTSAPPPPPRNAPPPVTDAPREMVKRVPRPAPAADTTRPRP